MPDRRARVGRSWVIIYLRGQHSVELKVPGVMKVSFFLVTATFFVIPIEPAGALDFLVQSSGGNCGECAWVLARGDIEPGDTHKLKAMASSQELPRNIRFDSDGGSLLEAMELGRFLRSDGWDSFVGDLLLDESAQEKCFSACAYAFIGGVKRRALPSVLGVHQFYELVSEHYELLDPTGSNKTSDAQIITAALYEYVREMGVDVTMVSIASSVADADQLHLFDQQELDVLTINTNKPSDTREHWRIEPMGNGVAAIVTQVQDSSGKVASLSIACGELDREGATIFFAFRDDDIDWSFVNRSWRFPLPMATEIRLKDKGQWLTATGSINDVPVSVTADGTIYFSLAMTKDSASSIYDAELIEVSAFHSMALMRTTGPIEGVFGTKTASQAISLALKNCPVI